MFNSNNYEDEDITRQSVEAGLTDIQGIAWERYHPITRDEFRESRIVNYRNYKNLDIVHDGILKVIYLCVVVLLGLGMPRSQRKGWTVREVRWVE